MTEQRKAPRVVGLQYKQESGVPRVILKGAGITAERVINEAKSLDAGPLIVKNEELLEQLYRLPTDAAITPDLYELVAILLVHVYAIDERLIGSRIKS